MPGMAMFVVIFITAILVSAMAMWHGILLVNKGEFKKVYVPGDELSLSKQPPGPIPLKLFNRIEYYLLIK
jgi:hypothetical protein